MLRPLTTIREYIYYYGYIYINVLYIKLLKCTIYILQWGNPRLDQDFHDELKWKIIFELSDENLLQIANLPRDFKRQIESLRGREIQSVFQRIFLPLSKSVGVFDTVRLTAALRKYLIQYDSFHEDKKAITLIKLARQFFHFENETIHQHNQKRFFDLFQGYKDSVCHS